MMSKMYMVIGAPGCGKSTYIQNHLKENEIVISRDKIRFSMLNDNDEYLMLIPQEATINITVHYSVITQDSNLDGGYSKVDNVISSNGFSFSFDRGKAYNFVLHLGMTSVQFDATINEWDETESDRIVHVPLNIKDNNN